MQLQEQNQRDLVKGQQPGSAVAPNPYSIQQQQQLELQLLNQAQPIVQDTPEPQSSSEQVGSTSWDHTNTHSSILSPTERNYRNYPVEPPAILLTALENLQAQGVFWQPPEQDPDQDLEGLEYEENPERIQDWDEQADILLPPPNTNLPLYHLDHPQFQQHAQAVVPIEYLPPANPQPPPPPPRQMAAQVATPWGADPKWPKLPIFDSSYNTYPSWKNQFELYIDGHPHHFANDA
jgi:hypothetical protein